jgi:hypothetical protein
LASLQTVLSRSRRLNGRYQRYERSQDHEDLNKTLHLLASSSSSFCGYLWFADLAAATVLKITYSAGVPSGLANTDATKHPLHR